MNSFSNKLFIFIIALVILFLVTFYSVNLLSSKTYTSYQKIPKIHSLLLIFNVPIVVSWCLLGPAFGISFLLFSMGIIFLIVIGSNFGPFSTHIVITLLSSLLSNHFYSKDLEIKNSNKAELQKEIEKKNTILNKYNKQKEISKAWDKKRTRYSALKKITELLSSTLILDELAKKIVENTIDLIGKSGVCLLYIVDEIQLQLSLIASRNRKRDVPMKEKNGDIFDQWVFRKRQPINISNIHRDFRFNPKDINKLSRDFKSVLAAPMITENRVLGILRLDSQEENTYSPDDLRLLDIIADLSAVGIENSMLYKRIEKLAIKDDLTNLFLRRYFEDCYIEEFNIAAHYNKPLSLLMLDIDHFKQYNDTYGHTAGDIVLKEVAKMLKKNIEDESLLARFGGEEFIIILPNTEKPEAVDKANLIREEIQGHSIVLRRKETNITISIGVSTFPEDSNTKSDLIHQTDMNLYKAKTEGRNRVCHS